MATARTLFDKVWESHVVVPEAAATPALLYIDMHIVQEVSSPQAFGDLRDNGLKVRCPQNTIATADHATPTDAKSLYGNFMLQDSQQAIQVRTLTENCKEFGIELYDLDSDRRGIVHVIGPELGATQPGSTVVCGDSHTSTHGAFGALAFGIGTTEVGHVLATQCLQQRRPKTLAVNVIGDKPKNVTAKDLVLKIIGQLGIGGGTNHVIEYRGDAIKALSMDERMTVCNMSIEAGARAGMIGPDEATFEYLSGREFSPKGEDWDKAVAYWKTLNTDDGAVFDKEVDVDISNMTPQITYGTNPGMVIPVDGVIPSSGGDADIEKSLAYMAFTEGEKILGKPIDVAFVGSCTNARISDLRAVSEVLRHNKVADGVRMLIVPGSQAVKREAEQEGLHKVFLAAGAEWGESGCSMCVGINGDLVAPGKYSISTSNRNFEGRQGKGARTLLASPSMVAASAVAGVVATVD